MPETPGKPDPTDGIGTPVGASWGALTDQLVWTYPYHRAVFVGLNVLLTVVNVYTGKPWWALWPLLITGFVYMVHYLIYKASTVDDAWVDERAADLYDKSYDQGHISAIAGQHEMETAADRRAANARDAQLRKLAHRRRTDDAAK
jgi:2TM domain